MKINEMALLKVDAMDRAIALGEKFAEHFNKLFYDEDFEKNHHLSEMQAWWNKVKNIKLSYNKKAISDCQLIDWFFTAGQNFEDVIENNFIAKYKKFILNMLKNRNIDIKYLYEQL